MRRLLLAGLLLLASATGWAQKEARTLKQADGLVAQRQYESAYLLLDKFDPTNDRPAVVLKKAEVVLHYFSQSIMHRMFCLQDLPQGVTLDEARDSFTVGNMFVFDADSLLRRLLLRHPRHCALLKGYAGYYEALLDDYGSEVWGMYVDDTVLALLRQAVDCGSAEAAGQLGLYYGEQAPDSAIYWYRRATTLDDTNWTAWYNLGVNEYLAQQYADALQHVRRAYQGYTGNRFKADAARIVGLIHDEEMHNADSAQLYYEAALRLDTTEAWNYLYLLRYYLQTGDPRQNSLRERYWQFALGGDDTYSQIEALLDTYSSAGHAAELAGYLEGKASTAATDYERGICRLFAGQARAHLEQPRAAAAQFELAIPALQAAGAPEAFIESVRQAAEELKAQQE